MTKLWLIRHGETDWNVQRRFQGGSDVALNDNGRAQAATLKQALAEETFAAIYASDMIRVRQTAEIALDGAIESVRFDARLREIAFGDWEGLVWDEIQAKYPDDLEIWLQDKDHNAHGGDKVSDVIQRLQTFIDELRTNFDEDQQVLIFAHGATFGIFLGLLLGTNPQKWWQFSFQNCAISEIVLLPYGASLIRFNDSRHLD